MRTRPGYDWLARVTADVSQRRERRNSAGTADSPVDENGGIESPGSGDHDSWSLDYLIKGPVSRAGADQLGMVAAENHPRARVGTIAAATIVLALALIGSAGAGRDKVPPTSPTKLRVTSATAKSVSVAWSASTDNVRVASYNVLLGSKVVARVKKTSASISGLRCGRSYTVGVQAVDGAVNRSARAWTTIASAACPDTQAPSVPSNIAQTATTARSVVLVWSPSTDNVGVVGYGVYVAGIRIANVSQASFAVDGLSCGQSELLGIDTVDASGNRSSQATVMVFASDCPSSPVDTSPPSMPANLSVAASTATSLSLGWTASTDNVGVTSYRISGSGIAPSSTSTTGSTVVGLACGTTYAISVVAVDGAGNTSAPAWINASSAACPVVRDTQPPTVPMNVKVASASLTQIGLAWSASADNVGVAGYRVSRNGNALVVTTSLAASVTGLACGTAYSLDVQAFDVAGNSSEPIVVAAATTACPDSQAPTIPTNVVVASKTATSITLSWTRSNDNVGVAGYGIYRGGTKLFMTTETTAVLSGLTCGTNHTLGIDATDAAGNASTPALVMVATTSCPDTEPPTAPTNLIVTSPAATSLTLSWGQATDNTGVVGYDVFQGGAKVAAVTSTASGQTGLSCGTTYVFAVAARDQAGNSSPQASVSATTSACSAPAAPCSGVTVDVATDLALAVESRPAGTTFCITSGLHRMGSSVFMKPGNRFIGAPGAVLNGARLLQDWVRSGSYWVISGQTQQHYFADDWCAGSSARCKVGDDVFFDDKPLQAVTDLGQLGSGKFFFDYANDKIYVADDPAAHKVEGAVATHAFAGCYSGPCGSATLIKGLTIEKFADTPIDVSDAVVEDNEVRLNHKAGIAVARDSIVRNNVVHDNGLEGFASSGVAPRSNLLFSGNETYRNGWYGGYDMGWEGGGGKWTTATTNLTVTGNYSHDNNGRGFWVDTNAYNVVFSDNRIVNNALNGILYEASFDAKIFGNTITGNGFGTNEGWMQGAGILIESSANVEVYGNTLDLNRDGIGATERGGRDAGPRGTPDTRNFYVHDNTVKTAGRSGLIQTVGNDGYYTSMNNRFNGNRYTLACAQSQPFAWRNPTDVNNPAYLSFPQWQATGNDAASTYTTYC